MKLRGKAHLMQQCDGAAAFSVHTGERRPLRGRKKKSVHCGALCEAAEGCAEQCTPLGWVHTVYKTLQLSRKVNFFGYP